MASYKQTLEFRIPTYIIKIDYVGSNKLIITTKNNTKIMETIESLMNLHQNTFKDININYGKYIIHCLINYKPIRFYIDSIINDYFEENENENENENEDNNMNIKYIVKLLYFKNEYIDITFEELIERGYFKLINEWRKNSKLFRKEIIKSSTRYYQNVYHKQLNILSNIDINPWNKKSEFIKMWFEINCKWTYNDKEKTKWIPNRIGDIGFGAAFPLFSLINTFKPSFVYALEINKYRYDSFKKHTKYIFDKYKSNQYNQYNQYNHNNTDPFTIDNKTHFIIDNRDFVSFCRDLQERNNCHVINYENGQNLIHSTKNKKISTFCSKSICDCNHKTIDLIFMYDLAEYMNDIDLDFCLNIISKLSYYLYFAVPIIEEYDLMDPQFKDKWAIKRTKKEYQNILLKYWRLVGNSFWESKSLLANHTNNSMIENAVCHI